MDGQMLVNVTFMIIILVSLFVTQNNINNSLQHTRERLIAIESSLASGEKQNGKNTVLQEPYIDGTNKDIHADVHYGGDGDYDNNIETYKDGVNLPSKTFEIPMSDMKQIEMGSDVCFCVNKALINGSTTVNKNKLIHLDGNTQQEILNNTEIINPDDGIEPFQSDSYASITYSVPVEY